MRTGLVLAGLVWPVLAQVQGPPPVLQIIRETVKEGKGAAHERAEAEYVQAFRKAKSEGYYLAVSTVSGANEVWFLGGYPSFAAVEKIRQESRAEPLKSGIEAAEEHDGALRETSRTIWAMFRADLSYNAEKLNVGKARFLSVGTYRVRLGHEAEMMVAAKAILNGYLKANIDETMLCYQVIAGAPAGTYLFMTPMESLKRMDEMPARQAALRQAMGGDGYQNLMKGAGETYVTIESGLFEVSPGMSYVSQQTIDADPAFWTVKPAPKPAAKATATAPARKRK
jgi:hypothetical protein